MNEIPTIKSHFLSDHTLLSPTAWQEAVAFCQKQNINLESVDWIIPRDDEEKTLLTLYRDQVTNLGEDYGNLGQASDYLRWIAKVYEQGVYTDFDVEVETASLPEIITMAQPIALPMSVVSLLEIHHHSMEEVSKLFPQDFLETLSGMDERLIPPDREVFLPCSNNDVIFVASAKNGTEEPRIASWIKRIKRHLIECSRPSNGEGNNTFADIGYALKEDGHRFKGTSVNYQLTQQSKIVSMLGALYKAGMNTRQLRWYIQTSFSEEKAWVQQVTQAEIKEKYDQTLMEQSQFTLGLNVIAKQPAPFALRSGSSNCRREAYDLVVQTEQAMSIATVTETSGPNAILSVIKSVLGICSILDVSQKKRLQKLSMFTVPGVGEAFASANRVTDQFQVSPGPYLKFLAKASDQSEISDVSWLPKGAEKLRADEADFNTSAVKVQGFFRRRKLARGLEEWARIEKLDGDVVTEPKLPCCGS